MNEGKGKDYFCSIEEYNALKQELLMLSHYIYNYNIYMHVICVTILIFSIERGMPVLSLMVYVIIISFQSQINQAQEGCSRISAYICAFLQPDDKYFYWENERIRIKEYLWDKNGYKNKKRSMRCIMYVSGPFGFSLMSVSICFYYNIHCEGREYFYVLLASSLLFLLTLYLNKMLFGLGDKMCSKYVNDLMCFKITEKQR